MSCKQGVISLIDRIKSTIEIIPADDFSRPLELYNGSTIGEHFRHIYDFFHCLIEQCHDDQLDYALRMRDKRIASDKEYSIEAFQDLAEQITTMNESVKTAVSADFEVAGDRPMVQSTIGRELMYAYDHAVHHLAIVKIGVQAISPNVGIDSNLGVASSTIRHRKG